MHDRARLGYGSPRGYDAGDCRAGIVQAKVTINMRRPYAIHRPVENSYLVRERDRRLIRELLAVVALVLVLGGGLLVFTWVHIEIVRTGYRIEERERELHSVLEEERRCRLEVARMTHPEHIEERASRILGMRSPTLAQTVFYQELAR